MGVSIKDFLFYKRFRKNREGITAPSISDRFITSLSGVDIMGEARVLDDEVCRPDKIAAKWYGNPKYDWIIMKFNGISNPFALNTGTWYSVPEIDKFMERLSHASTPDPVIRPIDKDKKLLNKAFKVDENKILYNKKKNPVEKLVPGTGVTIQNGTMLFSDNERFRRDELSQQEIVTSESQIPAQLQPECQPNPSDVLLFKLLSQNGDLQQEVQVQNLRDERIVLDEQTIQRARREEIKRINPNIFTKR